MDFIEEGNLRECLKNNKLSFQEKLQQLFLIAQGLSYIHQQDLVHRDFHSGNILTRKSDDQQILSYITDLGLCKPVGEEDGKEIYGVLPYVAPEVLRKKPYTKESDVYSFGIVAYELLTNVYPYNND
ncbi:kinase-like domain-containing protein [Glomus cerebriforme]|uniref:Kinase-like domain-containing protein n=1 Tax=Glomus cerebriforme TaxID=658196 RepID=A0A397SBG3_9GLOM|nr:kinase-like domain-containing protein [Glomus cerebriforme]